MKRFFLAAAALSALATRTTAQAPDPSYPYVILGGPEYIFLHLDFEGMDRITSSTDKSPGGNLGTADQIMTPLFDSTRDSTPSLVMTLYPGSMGGLHFPPGDHTQISGNRKRSVCFWAKFDGYPVDMSLIKMGDSDVIAELAEEGEFVCNDFLIAVSSEGNLELKTGVNDLCNVKVPSITLRGTWSHYCVVLAAVGPLLR